jgi:AraC family transcriptional regulator
MEYVERINRAIDFIENHLTESFPLADAAREACLSYFHFHRVFRALTGMTLGEYAKNRRLSEAAKRILDGMPLSDAAFDYQFTNQQDFTRSFRKRFGIPPGKYRDYGLKSSIMERCVFSRDLVDCFNTLANQSPEIVFIDPQPYIGLLRSGENIHEENLKLNYALVERMHEIPLRVENECTIFNRYKTEGSACVYTYITAFKVSRVATIPPCMMEFVFGGNYFAIFKYRGTVKGLLGKIYGYIFHVWPYNSPYEIIPEAFNSARFHNNFCVPENEEMEIIIPVRKKAD